MFRTLLNLFGERKPRANEQRRASVTIYPNRITIDTYHKVGKEAWDWRPALYVTRLSVDATKEEIGKVVRHHLELTRYNVTVEKPKIGFVSGYWLKYLEACGVRNEAELHEGAIHVQIYELEGKMRLVPTNNCGSSGRDRGFHEKDWQTIKCSLTDADEKIGAKIRKALSLSEGQYSS